MLRRLRIDPDRRFARRVARLLSAETTGARQPLVGVHQPAPAALLRALDDELPEAEVLLLPRDGSRRHVLMAERGPFDAIVDCRGRRRDSEGPRRRRRMMATIWHLRPGAPYVVPDGGWEVGDEPGAIGSFLRRAARAPQEQLGAERLGPDKHIKAAVKLHLRARAVGADLVLTHDRSDVLVKLREDEADAYLRAGPARHRIAKELPAEEPPPAPPFREGPTRRTPPLDRPIHRASPSLREYRDIVVAPRQIVSDGRILLPDTYRHNQARILAHDHLADLATRFAVRRSPLPDRIPTLEGTFLHLDNEVRGHFGHLLTETVGRLWTWPEALAIDPDVRVLVGATAARPQLAGYEFDLLAAAGIPRDRIVLIEEPVRVERLISGTGLFSNPEYVHPRIAETWQSLGDALAATAEPRAWPDRFFVSRRIAKRACVNGAEVEAIFADHGFEIVFPEDYSLGEQVELFRSGQVIAGYAGSGMFQTMFVSRPLHVIQIASRVYRPRNEYLIAAVHGHRLDAVVCEPQPYAGKKRIQAPFRYDERREGPFLRGILDELPLRQTDPSL